MRKALNMKWASMLVEKLEHPLTRGRGVDDPQTIGIRKEIIKQKKILQLIYQQWYAKLKATLPAGNGSVVEIGSGAGFLSDVIPECITSDVSYNPWSTLVLDGQRLPFTDQSLRAILMVDVLHHLPAVPKFLNSAARCVRTGGIMSMVEPWVTPWSHIFFRYFQSEPFLPNRKKWEFVGTGPLSGANIALPWILFKRDRSIFERQFPQWQIQSLEPMMPFTYLFSGGVSMRSLMPAFTFSFWHAIEKGLTRLTSMALFAIIVLVRTDVPANH